MFDMMDVDQGGTIDVHEMCIVSESDKETMIQLLDVDGNTQVRNRLLVCHLNQNRCFHQVEPSEWEHYLDLKKQEKGAEK